MKLHLKLGLLLLALSLPAGALTLHEAMTSLGQAKADGLIGEQPDGYLGVIRASAQADAIAAQINQARRAEYHRLAAQNGINVRDVERLAGKKAIEKTPGGQYVLIEGRWLRK